MDNIFGATYDVNTPSRMYIENPLTQTRIRNPDPNVPEEHSNKYAWIDVLGPASDIQRKLDDKQSNDKISKTFKAQQKGLDIGTAFTAEKSREENLEELTFVVTGWNLLRLDTGAPIDLECNPKNIRLVFTAPKHHWLMDDLNDYRTKVKNFMTVGG